MSGQAGLSRAVGALLAVFAVACGEATDQLGSVMLAISTDMYVDKDVSRVDIVVQPARGPLQSTQINLFPELEGQFLPGTFSIIEGSVPGELVRVRVIARQDSRVRVVREAALKVPRQRTALLSMPIQWLCDGQVRQEGQLHRSDCDDGFTCISGTCQPEEVDEATLPDYQIEDVFGGGDATGGGSCFDTLECFRNSTEPALDLPTCRFTLPDEDNLNVAVVLPPGGDGHCTGSECWIPLDHSDLTGWSVDAALGKVQLPVAICERARASGARVFMSSDCAPKAPATPTCGPWTLVGTTPGADVDTPNPNQALLEAALVTQLTETSRRLASEVAGACASVAAASPPAEPGAADVDALCLAARESLGAVVPLTWHHSPSRCWPDHEGQIECERDCDPGCEPGTLEQRCITGGLAGACTASCESRVCLAAEGVPVPCAGGCVGSCTGACEGNCLGACDGVCSNPSPDGYCDGTCAGTCAGLCQGRCQGTCEGRCDGDPGAPAATCASGSQCVGGCAEGFEAPTCDGPIGSGACGLEPGCQGNCQVMATFKVQCETPTAWVLPKPGLDAAMSGRLVEALPLLVNVRDAKTLAVLDEATRLQERMRTNPATPEAQQTEVDNARALLDALTSTTTSLLLAVGQERTAFGPGPVLLPPDVCEPVSATGISPLIDDFEDGDARVLLSDGRDGAWHAAHDGTGEINLTEPPIPELGGANGSTRAMHLSGSGFTEWGAGLNIDLREAARPYDASVHQGVSFWARGVNRLRFTLIQANLSSGQQTCGEGCTLATECNLFYTTELTLSDVWTQLFVPWTLLSRDFQGGVAVGPEQLLSIRFEGPPSEAVDFWLDDVAFY